MKTNYERKAPKVSTQIHLRHDIVFCLQAEVSIKEKDRNTRQTSRQPTLVFGFGVMSVVRLRFLFSCRSVLAFFRTKTNQLKSPKPTTKLSQIPRVRVWKVPRFCIIIPQHHLHYERCIF